jgi:hypothetical protein
MEDREGGTHGGMRGVRMEGERVGDCGREGGREEGGKEGWRHARVREGGAERFFVQRLVANLAMHS